MSEAEYLMRRALEMYAGNFNKQHGDVELTCRRGMKAMEKSQEIYDITIDCYKDDPVAHKQLKKIMDWWLRGAKHLHKILLAMKSQKKVSKGRLGSMKDDLARYLGVWIGGRDWGDRNPLYWKLHVLICCLIPFAERTGMMGKVSTEGMENAHNRTAMLKGILTPLQQTSVRVNKMINRIISRFCPGIGEKLGKLTDAMAGMARAPYKNRGKKLLIHEDATEVESLDSASDVPNGFFETKGNALLDKKFFELYTYLEYRKVPKEFLETIKINRKVGIKKELEGRFL